VRRFNPGIARFTEHGKMKNFLVFFSLSLILVAGGAVAQNKIYKTTDSDGNVVYTDQPPPGGGKPMDLPLLSIVSTRENQGSVRSLGGRPGSATTTDQPQLPPAAQLRQTYSAAEISSPQQEQTIWGTGNSITVSVDLKAPLLPGLLVQVIYDGLKLPARPSTSVQLAEIDRGEHTVFAEIVDATGEVYGRTEPVTFFMRQHSVNFNTTGRNNSGN